MRSTFCTFLLALAALAQNNSPQLPTPDAISPDDHKYFAFQLWQEGIARYTQILAAEEAAQHRPTKEYAALPDFESFDSYASRAKADTLQELKRADLALWKRNVVYSFGAAEGLLLDRLNPKWKAKYFQLELSTDGLFEN